MSEHDVSARSESRSVFSSVARLGRERLRRYLVVGLAVCMLAALAGCEDEKGSQDGGGDAGDGGVTSEDGGDTSDDDGDTSDDGGDVTGDSGPGQDASGPVDPDINGDGTLDILVIGTSDSIRDSTGPFAPSEVSTELQSILEGDASLGLEVNVDSEDIYASSQQDVGLGGGGDLYPYTFTRHSLVQYYYWPEGSEARLDVLAGEGETDWDQVIIGADPAMVGSLPGFYALGVNKVADQVRAGGGQPRLLMVWPAGASDEDVDHLEEMTYRVADGARVPIPVVPAALAWEGLSEGSRDSAASHPSPNGAYLTAATIYSELLGRSASSSSYEGDEMIADSALATVEAVSVETHYTGSRSFVSPFAPGRNSDRILNYNHTGTSSERGILRGLEWVLERARVQLVSGGDRPLDFNYGRANTNFEANKRYQIDPARFEYSFGFPMQDHGSTGDLTMLYGIDQRNGERENGTDLGAAFKMVRDDELPEGRILPIRTLFAQMREVDPTQSAYRDDWHMHRNLDRATAAFLYTLLTGHCALGAEPADRDSAEWRQWMAHRVGYETAWTLMHLRASAPGFRVLPEAPESVSVTPGETATLALSFANPPTHEVIVRISSDNDGAVSYSPAELVFTPENHADEQLVTMTASDAGAAEESYTIIATTASEDPSFDAVVDRWEYSVVREP